MKKKTQGKACEEYVRKHFPAWKSRGWLPYQNHKKAGFGYFAEGEPVDFPVLTPAACVLLECKECSNRRFTVGGVERILKQANNLDIANRLGHVGLFVIMFIAEDGTQEVGVFWPKKVLEGVSIKDSIGKLDEILQRIRVC